jgi:hypothetical protein
VDVHGVIVKFVAVVQVQLHFILTLEFQKIILLVVSPLELNVRIVTDFQFILNIQLVRIISSAPPLVKSSHRINVHHAMFSVIDFAHDFQALVNVLLPLHSKIYACELAESVVRSVRFIPQKILHAVVVVHVLFEDPVKSILPIRGMS